jgi:hypothetical protein
VIFLDYFLNLSRNISALGKDRSIRLPLYESSLNSGSNRGSVVNSGLAEASGY